MRIFLQSLGLCLTALLCSSWGWFCDDDPPPPEYKLELDRMQGAALPEGMKLHMSYRVAGPKGLFIPLSPLSATQGLLESSGPALIRHRLVQRGTQLGLQLLQDEPGSHLELELGLRAQRQNGQYELTWLLPQMPERVLELSFPPGTTPWHIHKHPSLELEPRQQSRRLEIALNGSSCVMNWPAETETTLAKIELDCSVQADLAVEKGLAKLLVKMDCQLRSGQLEQLRLSLAKTLQISRVTLKQGPATIVCTWSVQDGILQITPSQSLQAGKGFLLELQGEQALGEGDSLLSLPRLEQATMTAQGLWRSSVATQDGVQAQFTPQGGLVPVYAAEQIQSEALLGYAFYDWGVSLGLRCSVIRPQLWASLEQAVTVREHDLKIQLHLDLQIRQAPLSSIELQLPPGLCVLSAGGRGYDIKDLTDGQRLLTVHLGGDILGECQADLEFELPCPDQSAPVPLPILSLKHSASQDGHLYLGSDEGLSPRLDKVQPTLRPVPPSVAAQRLSRQSGAWRWRQSPGEAMLAITRLQPRLQTESLHLYALGEDRVYASCLFNMTVSGSPMDRFAIELPAGASAVEVAGELGLRLLTGPDGSRELSLPRKVLGPISCLVSWQQPLDRRGTKLLCGSCRLRDAVSGSGFITFSGDEALRVEAATAAGIYPLAPEQLPAEYRLLHRGAIIAAFRQVDAAPLTVTVSALDAASQLRTVAELMSLSSVLTAAGESELQVDLRIKNGQRQEISFTPPAGYQLSRCKVGGQLSPCSRGEGAALLIPLPRLVNPNEVITATLWLSGKGAELKSGTALKLELPRLDVPVIHTQWRILTPEGLYLKDLKGDMVGIELNHRPAHPSSTDLLQALYARSAVGIPILFFCAFLCCMGLVGPGSWVWRGMLIASGSGGTFSTLYALIQRLGRSLIDPAVFHAQTEHILRKAATPADAGGSLSAFVSGASVAVEHPLSPLMWALIVLGLVITALGCRYRHALPCAAGLALSLPILAEDPQLRPLLCLALFLALPILTALALALALRRWRLHRISLHTASPALLLLLLLGILGLSSPVQAKEAVEPAAAPQTCPPPVDPAPIPQQVGGTIQIGPADTAGLCLVQARLSYILRALPGEEFRLDLPHPWVPLSLQADQTLIKLRRGPEGTFASLIAPKDAAPDVLLQAQLTMECRALVKSQAQPAVDPLSGVPIRAETLDLRSLLLPAALIRRISLQLSGEGWLEEADPALWLKRRAAAGLVQDSSAGQSLIDLQGRASLPASLQRFVTQQQGCDFTARWESSLILQPQVAWLRHQLQVQVVRGGFKELQVRIPAGQDVVRIADAQDRELRWSFDRQSRLLQIQAAALAGQNLLQLTLLTRQLLGSAPCEPLLELPTTTAGRHVGGRLLVQTARGLRSRLGALQGLELLRSTAIAPADARRLDADSGQQLLVRLAPESSLRLALEPVQPQLSAQVDSRLWIGEDKLSLEAQIQIQILRADAAQVRLLLPAAYEIENILCDGRRLDAVDEIDPQGRHLLALGPLAEGDHKLSLRLFQGVDAIPAELAYPRLRVADALRESGSLALSVEAGWRMDPASFEHLSQPELDEQGVLRCRIQRADYRLLLRRRALSPEITMHDIHELRCEEGLLRTLHQCTLTVEQAPVRSFVIKTPGLQGPVDVHGRDITSVTDLGEGRHQVELVGRRIGAIAFTLRHQAPAATLDSLHLHGIQLEGANRQHGQILVFIPQTWRLELKDQPAPLKELDFRTALQQGWAQDAAQAAFIASYAQPGWQLQAAITRAPAATKESARALSLNINTQIGPEGAGLSFAELLLEPGQRPYLGLRLPPGARLVNAQVAELSVRCLEAQDGLLLIPLARSGSSGQSSQFKVQILYFTPTSSFDQFRGPAFDLPLHNVTWSLWLPENGLYRDFGGTLKYVGSSGFEMCSAEHYRDQAQARAADSAKEVQSLLAQAMQKLNEGQRQEAELRFEQASLQAIARPDLYEDARMQLLQGARQKAQLALALRRQQLAKPGSPRTVAASADFSTADLQRACAPLSDAQNSSLGAIGEKLFSQQNAASAQLQPLHLILPRHGWRINYARELAVEPFAELQVQFHADFKPPQLPSSPLQRHLFTILAFLAGLLLFLPLRGSLRWRKSSAAKEP